MSKKNQNVESSIKKNVTEEKLQAEVEGVANEILAQQEEKQLKN